MTAVDKTRTDKFSKRSGLFFFFKSISRGNFSSILSKSMGASRRIGRYSCHDPRSFNFHK